MKWNNLYFHIDAVKRFHIECVVISVTNLQDSGEVRSKSSRWIQGGAGIRDLPWAPSCDVSVDYNVCRQQCNLYWE